jgi:hypothetical protein
MQPTGVAMGGALPFGAQSRSDLDSPTDDRRPFRGTGQMDPTILSNTFWICEVLTLSVIVAPIWRFFTKGWAVRKQDFTNRLCGKPIDIYLDRFWADTIKKRLPKVTDSDQKFSAIYNMMAGRSLYITPALLLVITVAVFGGFAIQTGLRAGYEQYISFYAEHHVYPPRQVQGLIDKAFLPFPLVVFSVPTMASVAGAYLYASQVVISGYQTRTLLSSDLLWSAFRLVIAIPLGMCVALPGTNSVLPLVGFALGAFPIGTINKLLRRLAGRSLNDAELQDNKDDLLKLTGITPDVSAQLQLAGVASPQQLADMDPVSLSLRTGLPFDFVLSLAAQGQVWSIIGAETGALAPLGFGEARAISKLMTLSETEKNKCLAAIASKTGFDLDLLTFNFETIAKDDYTVFLTQISGSGSELAQLPKPAGANRRRVAA